ncbi:response regulator [Brevibacillus fluminis]|uniref:response regulator n=1 Tax=Brevibacillus fluminis TaxID=511487 RepID=UPI003F8B2CD5
MRYKTRMFVGFGAFLIMLLVLLAIISSILTDLNKNINEIVDDRYVKLKAVNAIQNHVNNMSRWINSIVLDETKESVDADMRAYDQATIEITQSMQFLQNKILNEQARLNLAIVTKEIAAYEQKADDVIELVKAGKKEQAVALVNGAMRTERDDMFEKMDELKAMQETLMDEAYASAKEKYDFIRMIAFAFTILGALVGLIIAAWVIRGISRSLREIASVITSVAFNNVKNLPRMQVKTKDEIGEIARAYNEMAETLEEHVEQEDEYKEAMQEHNWLKTQIAEISKGCQEVQDISRLSQFLISKLTPLVGGSYGVLYTREGSADSLTLVKSGTYAIGKQLSAEKTIDVGEGMIGQCVLENKPIYLAQIPPNYFKIGSALGNLEPTTLIILPIPYEGKVLAVLEIASLYEFSPLQQNLLHEITSSIGATFSSMYKHMQVVNLLRESQTLTEELQSQSEELRLQQEELRSINEKLEEQYKSAELKAKELEKAKEVLEDNEVQIKQASRYKSEFLANMSHELRTPLNSLLILAQILAENKEQNLTEKQVEFAKTIYSSGNNLLLLINDILDLTKVESGKMEIHPAELKLQEILDYAERSFRPIAQQKQLSFTVAMDENVPQSIVTDEQRLQQIIANLLSNAFKFTSAGSVHFHITLQETEEGSNLAFLVRDTGCGISSDKQTIIFEAFAQGDGTTSRKYGGTGLGLSISRELAQLLGGFIQVESVEGIGSSFTLYVPLSRKAESAVLGADAYVLAPVAASAAEQTEADAEKDREEGVAGRNVLIVDDDMRNIFALTAALEERGMNVFFAENGREGILVLQENPFIDIVLMDIMMPEMDGYETIEAIRNDPGFHHLPIIALTAKAMKHDRAKCMEAGASDYISKPVNVEQLISLMRVWLYR